MSYIGKNPIVETLGLTPLSADPINPTEGMQFYSDGTSRAEGIWVYRDGSWVTNDIAIVQEKAQTKYLPATIQTNSDLASISFSNLTIGKQYRLTLEAVLDLKVMPSAVNPVNTVGTHVSGPDLIASAFTDSGLIAQNGGIDILKAVESYKGNGPLYPLVSKGIAGNVTTTDFGIQTIKKVTAVGIFTAITTTVVVRTNSLSPPSNVVWSIRNGAATIGTWNVNDYKHQYLIGTGNDEGTKVILEAINSIPTNDFT